MADNEHEGTAEDSPPDRSGERAQAEGMEGKEEDSMSIEDIKMPWEYTDEELAVMQETIGEHGRCIDYRQEAYHDVHVFEDGHEERLYIGD